MPCQHHSLACSYELQRRQGAGEAIPHSARVHTPFVPTNNGGDEQALEPMTQTQA